ncbi:MAG: hypothetical protein AAF714_07125 [Pseudomonadota bacterium]
MRHIGEERTALFGLFIGILSFPTLAWLNSGFVTFLLTPLFALRTLAGTAITGLMSRRTDETAQGELQGILSAVTASATLVAIPLMTQIFALANSPELAQPWPGAPFALSALFSAGALTLLVIMLRASSAPLPIQEHTHAPTS